MPGLGLYLVEWQAVFIEVAIFQAEASLKWMTLQSKLKSGILITIKKKTQLPGHILNHTKQK